MKQDIRRHLESAFLSDASALRMRAQSFKSKDQVKLPGPDAAMSLLMAEACDRVVELVQGIPADASSEVTLEALSELVVPLVRLAKENSALPQVRAVYSGAATRIEHFLDSKGALKGGKAAIRAPGKRPMS